MRSHFSVYPTKADVNKFFITVKQGNDQATEAMRQDMATKYYVMANDKPELKVDLFKSKATEADLAQFDRVNIFKTKEQENNPSKILLLPTVNGERLKPREVSRDQWQRLWLADDMQDYKKHLAASLFADVLRKDQSNSVAVGTSKTEQEAQTEVKEALHAEFHEQNEKHEEKQEQEHADYHQQEDKKNSPEQRKKRKQEEKAKRQTTKAETKA
jgi:hypothetical protein